MSAEQLCQEDDVEWVKSYAVQVSEVFSAKFKGAGNRFKGSERLMGRFFKAVESVLTNGHSVFRAVDELHNELCIASALLSNPSPKFTCIDYEPVLAGSAKSIDFRAVTNDGLTVFVDVKTIKPMPTDRWDQFEVALQEGWLPKSANVLLSEDWLGGELWHGMFAARSRMLEYSLELEEKIRSYNLAAENTCFVLAFCGEGFSWHEDQLEDFVSFYYTGSHRSDDPFSKVEAKHIKDKKITIAKTIARFACMRRPQGDIHHQRLNWNVQPPKNPNGW
ncbi:hypothetical protein [Methylocaldum sp.]|uniref:hypothetical protein n=1 Tax=Methylocaldum sp. TaxID=1969727 RepID=UPI002D514E8E|nr:hypothetical protein [Methylocaldum sp.]HYE35127.1 hypothetical protein [Methylocaldum sp.]